MVIQIRRILISTHFAIKRIREIVYIIIDAQAIYLSNEIAFLLFVLTLNQK